MESLHFDQLGGPSMKSALDISCLLFTLSMGRKSARFSLVLLLGRQPVFQVVKPKKIKKSPMPAANGSCSILSGLLDILVYWPANFIRIINKGPPEAPKFYLD